MLSKPRPLALPAHAAGRACPQPTICRSSSSCHSFRKSTRQDGYDGRSWGSAVASRRQTAPGQRVAMARLGAVVQVWTLTLPQAAAQQAFPAQVVAAALWILPDLPAGAIRSAVYSPELKVSLSLPRALLARQAVVPQASQRMRRRPVVAQPVYRRAACWKARIEHRWRGSQPISAFGSPEPSGRARSPHRRRLA